MDEEKKNILAKLYTLRAGMSAISVRKEKIDKSNENIRVRQKKKVQLIREINQQVQDNKEQIEIAQINLRYRPTKRQGNMTECFSRLFDGLTVMHQSIISQIKTGQEIQRMQLQSFTTELNNAVQQRKNDSTIALAQDMRYIKTIVENEEIQKRNAV